MPRAAAPPEFANAFLGAAKPPTDRRLTAALGLTRPLWDQLLRALADELGAAVHEWHSYSPKAGWSLKVKRGDRTMVYFSPGAGCFRASFALGDPALKAARHSGLPARVLKIIDEAKKYPEGTAVRLLVTAAADVAIVMQLAQAKRDH